METTTRPMTSKELAELRGYVSPGIVLFRAVVFVAVVGAFGVIVRALQRVLDPRALLAHPAWAIALTAAVAIALYIVSRRWTGGRALRAKIRSDWKRGVAAVHRIRAVDAIAIEEEEDEGPAIFLQTDDGRTLVFSGQYLEPYCRRGFPWTDFEVSESPEARIFLGIRHDGERLVPSLRRRGLTAEQTRRLRLLDGRYEVIDVDFSALKHELSRSTSASKPNETGSSSV